MLGNLFYTITRTFSGNRSVTYIINLSNVFMVSKTISPDRSGIVIRTSACSDDYVRLDLDSEEEVDRVIEEIMELVQPINRI